MRTIFNKWTDFIYKLPGIVLTKEHISNALINLFESELSNLDKEQIIMIQFKIRADTNLVRSVSWVQTIKLSEFTKLRNLFNNFWEEKNENYHQLEVEEIIFSYKILPLDSIIKETKLISPKRPENKKGSRIYGHRLPFTMDCSKWGKIIYSADKLSAWVQRGDTERFFNVKFYDTYQEVELRCEEGLLLSFKDYKTDPKDLSTFKRVVKDQTYHYVKGELVLKQFAKKTKFLKKISLDKQIFSHFLTMDLETRTINGIMEAISISIFDGKETSSFYLPSYQSSEEMLKAAVNSILFEKYKNHVVYLHNFSNFDGVFLIKVFTSLGKEVKPIIRNSQIIDLKIKISEGNWIYFRDSYLLMPSSLANLAKSFQVENKGIFPYSFVNNEKTSLNYIGEVPSISYFNNLPLEEHDKYKNSYQNKIWDLKKELIKYCEQDVKVLHQVISKFSTQIFEMFNLNLHKYPTLSSLAFAIFRSKYLKDEKLIPLIYGEMFEDLKKAYTGGSVDIFKPQPAIKSGMVYGYDVNSLYPNAMKNFFMPTGKIIYFEGDISFITKKAFGFFEVEVIAPEGLNIPILQTKIKTHSGGTRTISPLGNWTGWYFSEELYNAKKYGYEFKILRGYTFDKTNIFKKYVADLYKIKKNSSNASPKYIIAKLLLNTLYGLFGMNPDSEIHKIINFKDFDKYALDYDITDVINLQNGKELISYFPDKSGKENNSRLNISISISAAVTAYGRVHMSFFKDMKELEILYSDTDSLYTSKPLDPKHIGKKIGQMKLERVFEGVVFFSSKGLWRNYWYWERIY